jgi:hypothetical protein
VSVHIPSPANNETNPVALSQPLLPDPTHFDFAEMIRTVNPTTEVVFPLLDAATQDAKANVDTSISQNKNRDSELDRQIQLMLETHRKFEAMAQEHEVRIRAVEAKLAVTSQQRDIEHKSTLQGLRILHERLQHVERNFGEGGLNSGMTQEQADKLEQLERAVFAPQGSMENLKLQFSQFREKMESGGGITCNNITFGSKQELFNWFDTTEPPVEIFMDALAYLHAIRSPVVYQDEATRQREAQIKTNMTNQLQVAVYTSFDTVIPSVFVGGKRSAAAEAGNGSIFSWLHANMKTFEEWKPKGGQSHGVSHTISNGIGRVTDCINKLRSLQTSDHQAVMLSVGLCTDAALFCTELVRFMTDQHTILTADTTLSEKQVWSMQLECLQTIIEELSEARGRVMAAANFQPGLYLWGMLRAWKVQKRYLANNFKDDPALTGIMVRRILMQGQDSSVKDKLAKIELLSNKVEEHHRQEVAEIKKLKDIVAELKKKKGNNRNNNNNNNNNDDNE